MCTRRRTCIRNYKLQETRGYEEGGWGVGTSTYAGNRKFFAIINPRGNYMQTYIEQQDTKKITPQAAHLCENLPFGTSVFQPLGFARTTGLKASEWTNAELSQTVKLEKCAIAK